MSEIEKLRSLLAVLLFTACTPPPQRTWHYDCDATSQREIFLSCLERLPRGPERLAVAGNDWDEVVAECRDTATRIACKVVWEVVP